jgi:hypothetical protein
VAASQVHLPNALPSQGQRYFDARNAMMYCRRHLRETLAVVRVNPAVLDKPGAIITDLMA